MSADLLLSARSALRAASSLPLPLRHTRRGTTCALSCFNTVSTMARWSRESLLAPLLVLGLLLALLHSTQVRAATQSEPSPGSGSVVPPFHGTQPKDTALIYTNRASLFRCDRRCRGRREIERRGACDGAQRASGSGVASLTRVRRREPHKPAIALMTRVIPLLPARSVLSQMRVLSRCPSPLSPTQPLVLLLRISKRQLMRGSLPGGRRMCQQIKVRNPQAISMDEC